MYTFLLSSNLAFSLPAGVAMARGFPFLGLSVTMAAVSSYIYHMNHSCSSAHMLDVVVAMVTFMFMSVLILCAGSAWLGSFALALAVIGISLFLDVGDYEDETFCVTHSLWHICMALCAGIGVAALKQGVA